jgi:malonyl-CoA O-methyltransferase
MITYKKRIKRSFSRAALTYDQYASVQKAAALRLIDEVGPHRFRKILEIGCGTGNYTEMLMRRFPTAVITAIDFSPEMISVAARKLSHDDQGPGSIKNRNLHLFVDDAETFSPDTGEKYDLITSNSTFQWLQDLKSGLSRYRDLLTKGGVIAFSIMGPETFCELHEVMQGLFAEKGKISAQYFMQLDDLRRLLHGLFENVKTREVVLTTKHASLIEMLRTMKYTGVNIRRNGKNTLFTRSLLKETEKAYIERFGAIRTSYQVFLCEVG